MHLRKCPLIVHEIAPQFYPAYHAIGRGGEQGLDIGRSWGVVEPEPQ